MARTSTERSPASALPDRLLRQAEAARHLAVSPSCLRKWDHLGIGPKRVRVPGGRSVLYRVSSLVEWATRNEIDPARVA